MRLRPFFSYYGSKHRIACRYPPPITGHIIDCFAGSAAYPCQYPALQVTLVEANPKVAGTWDYIIRAPESEVRSLPLLGRDEGVGALPDSLPQEARWLIGFWLAKGRGAPFINPSKWRREKFDLPEYAGSFWGERARERIASQQRRVRHWRVIEGDYTASPDVRADWFVDPPYEGNAGMAYNAYGSHKLNYAELALWCQRRRGQAIVCERAGASWLPFAPFLTALGTNGTHRTGISREVIWHRSDEPPVQASLFDCAA